MQPAAELQVRHPVAAYCLNATLGWFGQYVEAKLQERDKKTKKPKYRLESLLGIQAPSVVKLPKHLK